jgi:hypothetical protein
LQWCYWLRQFPRRRHRELLSLMWSRTSPEDFQQFQTENTPSCATARADDSVAAPVKVVV